MAFVTAAAEAPAAPTGPEGPDGHLANTTNVRRYRNRINMKYWLSITLILSAIFLVQACAPKYSHEKPERNPIFDDRDESKAIMRYLNNDVLNYFIMKQVFYDLALIRSVYGEKYPVLLWARFIPPGEYPIRATKELRRTNECVIYPKKIRDGVSYLFVHRWNEKHSDPIITLYYYFECKFDNVDFFGIHDADVPLAPEWWSDAEKNLELYKAAL
jgi:hypothetical protein